MGFQAQLDPGAHMLLSGISFCSSPMSAFLVLASFSDMVSPHDDKWFLKAPAKYLIGLATSVEVGTLLLIPPVSVEVPGLTSVHYGQSPEMN